MSTIRYNFIYKKDKIIKPIFVWGKIVEQVGLAFKLVESSEQNQIQLILESIILSSPLTSPIISQKKELLLENLIWIEVRKLAAKRVNQLFPKTLSIQLWLH